MTVRRGTRFSAAAALATSALVVAVLGGSSTAAAAPAWKQVWGTTFGGAAGARPSSAQWRYDTGPGSNFGTGEIETMTSSTANVDLNGKGQLAITPRRNGSAWTSGRIETNRDDFHAPNGGQLKVSARIEVPNATGAAGAGYWPAFWMLGNPLRNGGTWPHVGEFDALEVVNGQNAAHGTLHCGVNPGGPCNEPNGLGGSTACPDSACAGHFHTYTFVLDKSVSPQQMRWYVDGKKYWTVTQSQVDASAPGTWSAATGHGVYVILNVAMGGNFPNGVAGYTTPTASTQPGRPMLVDWVHVDTRGA